MPHVSQKFVRLAAADKPGLTFLIHFVKTDFLFFLAAKLVERLKASAKLDLVSIVFANKFKTAEYLHYYLQEHGIGNILLHAKMAEMVGSCFEDS
jgi:superfamily II DNA/RNA helicase